MTEEQIQYLRRHYGDHTPAQIARILGVKKSSVIYEAGKLGVLRARRHEWSDHEIDRLEELVYTHSTSQISKILNRTENAVAVKAKRLKLNRREFRDGWYTKGEVADILAVDPDTVQCWIDEGHLKARHHTEDGQIWHIDKQSLRDFIRTYPHELSGRRVDIIQLVDILVGIKITEEAHA